MSETPVRQKRPMSTGKKVVIGAAVLVCAPVVIAGMVSGAKQDLSSKPAAGKSTPTLAAPSKSTFKLTLPPHQLAPASRRRSAASILHTNDAYYRDEFNRGVTVIEARGGSASYPAFHAWYQKASGDVKPGTTAFLAADANFDASDEPVSIRIWQYDNGTLQADVSTLVQDGLDVGGPNDAAARSKVKTDIAKMHADYATAEHDADQVAAGK
ncbi:hypothetical protein [Actinacidiphila soli]|uniref:hypothetical protein n=1 Tax=Actinacidiphila soli TaxID=2487275 RepID=UPI000FCA4715|nr:hypothetical protein [Actinacidiphila soli]